MDSEDENSCFWYNPIYPYFRDLLVKLVVKIGSVSVCASEKNIYSTWKRKGNTMYIQMQKYALNQSCNF